MIPGTSHSTMRGGEGESQTDDQGCRAAGRSVSGDGVKGSQWQFRDLGSITQCGAERRPELGYLSNAHTRSLRSAHSGVIGLVVPDIRNPYFAELASVVENACLAHGWATLLCNADESPDQFNRYVDTLRRQRVDGAIVTPTSSGGRAVTELVDDGVQVVCVDREITRSSLSAVTSDP